MYKKKLINLCAVTLAMSLAFGSSLTAFAMEENDTTGETWTNTEGDTIVHDGDVTNNAPSYSTAYAEHDASVTVNGNVTNEADHRAVGAFDNSEVTINGDATAGKIGVTASDSTVTVTGDVTAGSSGVTSIDGADVNIGDDVVTQGRGIETDGTSDVTIGDDVTYGTIGIYINTETDSNGYLDDDEVAGSGTVIVNGTIADDGNGDSTAIKVKSTITEKEDLIEALPEIIVYEIEGDELVDVNSGNEETDQAVEEYITNNVQYIVKEDSSSASYYSIVDRESYVNEKVDAVTVTLNQALTIAASEGYTISAGDNVTMVQNEDGTYTITLSNSNGGITISAKLIQQPTAAVTTTTTTVETEESDDSGDQTQDNSEEVASDPFIFATFTVTGRSELPSVLGADLEGASSEVVEYASRPVVKVVAGPLTALEYKNAFINSVKNAPQGAIVRLETSMISCFDKMMLEALAARPDVTLEVVFPLDGETVATSIPEGSDVLTLLDENGYCGFLNVLATYGQM